MNAFETTARFPFVPSHFDGGEWFLIVPRPTHLLDGHGRFDEFFHRPRGGPADRYDVERLDQDLSCVPCHGRRLRGVLRQGLGPFHLPTTVKVIVVDPAPPSDLPPADQPIGHRADLSGAEI